jgi:hypothetical protein
MKRLMCDCCFHPVLEGKNCPFCGNTKTTQRCNQCNSIMINLPTPLTESKEQHICQMCAMEGRPQPINQ